MFTLVAFLGGLVIGSVGVTVILKKKPSLAETIGIYSEETETTDED